MVILKLQSPRAARKAPNLITKEILDNHILPVFEDMPIDEINSGAIKNFLFSKVNEGLSASTIGHIKNVVSGVFTIAVDDELTSTNPTLEPWPQFHEKNRGFHSIPQCEQRGRRRRGAKPAFPGRAQKAT